MLTEKNAGVNPPNASTFRPPPPGGSQGRSPWGGMTRQQMMDSEDIQHALMVLWCATPAGICSSDVSEWKYVTDGVLLCRDRGIGGTGAFYLWDGRDRGAAERARAFAKAVNQ